MFGSGSVCDPGNANSDDGVVPMARMILETNFEFLHLWSVRHLIAGTDQDLFVTRFVFSVI